MIHEFVMRFLSPVYQIADKLLPFLVLVVFAILIVITFKKILSTIPRKSDCESTNDWFDWDEYKEKTFCTKKKTD